MAITNLIQLHRSVPIQFLALLKKNVLISWRSRAASLLQLVGPVLCIFLLCGIGLIVRSSGLFSITSNSDTWTVGTQLSFPEPKTVGSIPSCNSDFFIQRKDCFAFIYAPKDVAVADEIVTGIRIHNDPPIPETEVLGLQNLREMDAWLLENPGKCLGGIYFEVEENNLWENSDPMKIRYVIQTNSTVWKIFLAHVLGSTKLVP